jgi:hypothetical protein
LKRRVSFGIAAFVFDQGGLGKIEPRGWRAISPRVNPKIIAIVGR